MSYYRTSMGSIWDDAVSYGKDQVSQLTDTAKVEAQKKIEEAKARATTEALELAAKGQAAAGQRILSEVNAAANKATDLIAGGGSTSGGGASGGGADSGTSKTTIAGIGAGTIVLGLVGFWAFRKFVL